MSQKTHKYSVTKSEIRIIIAITWCTFLVYNAQSLECYQCAGHFNESAPEPYMDCVYLNHTPSVVTCIGVTQCFETFGDNDDDEDTNFGGDYVRRGCVVTNTTKDQIRCQKFKEGGFEGSVCRCDTDLCNNHTEPPDVVGSTANCKLEVSSSSVFFGFVFLALKMITCI
ncbi:unnamed protein product [Allacma fusca]|uniref:Uncharacterized protein n=1 Tax=Allacma fusca TaxID=39272 RepID=A0A8J2MGA1_9HEXA|nr:unnamed protein product [Allacma fusca]